MKCLLITIAAVVLVGTAFADPIHEAAKYGDLAGVQAELDKGVDVNAKDKVQQTSLHLSARYGHEAVTEILIAKGADVNAKSSSKRTALYNAARYGREEIVVLLIANDAIINPKNVMGETPLDGANLGKHSEIADLLRKHGGKTGEELEAETQGLFDASRNGNFEGVKALLDTGADVNAKSYYDGGTPLHVAAWEGHKEIVKLLIHNGADVNATDVEEGRTPLHQATEGGHIEVVEFLMANGAYVNAQITDVPSEGAFVPLTGMTPLDLALWEGREKIGEILSKHGGYSIMVMGRKPILRINNDSAFSFSFLALGATYFVEGTQDSKQWEILKIIEGVGNMITGEYVEFIDLRRPLLPFKRNFYRVRVVE